MLKKEGKVGETMVLYDKSGNPEFYDIDDLSKIVNIIWHIQYISGSLDCISWGEKKPLETDFIVAQGHAKSAIEHIKKYNEIASEELRKRFNFSDLEKKCKIILEE